MSFTVQRTATFANWLRGLTDPVARSAILARLIRLELGNLGDCKNVGGKVVELRIDVGVGYRVTRRERVPLCSYCSVEGTSPRSRQTSSPHKRWCGLGRGKESRSEEKAYKEEA